MMCILVCAMCDICIVFYVCVSKYVMYIYMVCCVM